MATSTQSFDNRISRLEQEMQQLKGSTAVKPVFLDPINNGIDLPDGTVTAAKILDGSITAPKYAALSIGAAAIADLAVTEAKIDDLAVTAAKIATIHAESILAGEVTVQLDFTAGGKVIFGDTHRFDELGYQLRTAGAEVAAIYGLDEHSDTPDSNLSYWKLSGLADDSILESNVTLGLYNAGVVKSRLYLNHGSFTQAALYAGTDLVFQGSAFGGEPGAYVAPLLRPAFAWPDPSLVWFTIAAGVADIDTLFYLNGDATQPGVAIIDTEAAAATDDLTTLSSGIVGSFQRGQVVVLMARNSARTVVCKDGTGNMRLNGDMSLDNTEDTLTLIYNGTNWLEIARSNNGA